MDILIALADLVGCGKVCFVGTVRGGDDSCSCVLAAVARLVASAVGVWVCGVTLIGSVANIFRVSQRAYKLGLSPPPEVQYEESSASRKLLNEAPSTRSPAW